MATDGTLILNKEKLLHNINILIRSIYVSCIVIIQDQTVLCPYPFTTHRLHNYTTRW